MPQASERMCGVADPPDEQPMPNKTASSTPRSDVYDRVAQVIERLRPAIQDDDGDLELVDVTAAGVVKIRLHGACVNCPSSSMTLQEGVEKNVRNMVPEVVAVEQVP
jgi:Fe-S cluster biogenesis protein NfuA